ncbi:uncharacterized protein LOC143975614 [Lithobates pipiens]
MHWIATLVTLMSLTALGVKTQMSLSCSAGSRCSFPDTNVCNYTKNMLYELRKEQEPIGWYEKDLLTPRGQFMERLEFDNQRCVFILLKPSLVDTGMYTITVRYTENEEPKTPKMTINVTVFDPVTSTPFPPHEASMLTDPLTSTLFPRNTTFNLTACEMGFPAVLFSLAPLVNILINLLFLLPCRPSAASQKIQKRLLLISELSSLVCQVVSIGLGLSCGISAWLVLAIFCTVFLIADKIVSQFKCTTTDRFCKKLKLIQRIFFFVLQLSFPGFVVAAFYPIYGEKSGQTIWLSTTFSVIYMVIITPPYLVHTVYHFCCRPKTTEEADVAEMEKMRP